MSRSLSTPDPVACPPTDPVTGLPARPRAGLIANRARRGGGLIGFLVSVLLLAVVAVVGWAVYANWSHDYDGDGEPDGFTLRVLDQAWWQVAFSRAKTAKEDLTGEGGLLSQARDFLGGRPASEAAPAAPAPAGATAAESSGDADAMPKHSGTQFNHPDRLGADQSSPDQAPAGSEAAPAAAAPAAAAPAPAEDGQSPRVARLEDQLGNYADRFGATIATLQQASDSPEGQQARAEALAVMDEIHASVGTTLTEYRSLNGYDPELADWYADLATYAEQISTGDSAAE